MIDELAERFGDAPALLSARETFGFVDLARRSNQWSRWALRAGLRPGEVVALLMPNRPEYVAIWLGLTRVGVVTALLNTHLSGSALAHCLRLADPCYAIVDATLSASYADAVGLLDEGPRCAILDDGRHGTGAAQVLAGLSAAPLDGSERRPVTLSRRALLIFTSGTTGLPKAAVVSHRRILTWSFWFAGLAGMTPQDRMYDCLPLYHSVGGVVAVGSVLVAGGSVVIAEKFSARGFWDEISGWDCTLFQYIGELPRYLLKAPISAGETIHRLRLCLGNGLKADVWQPFQDRFAIPRILEFYAATEGSFSLFNVEGKVGAIGRTPAFLAHRFPAAIVRFDVETGLPGRDGQGWCVRCARNETGEAIGLINDGGAGPAGAFEGYTDEAESERKVLRNVFAEGDAWFRTGDLMRMDDAGFYFFVDRVGDTFRWKGENVSTAEVADALASFPGVADVNVYGVAVPGHDGRAGMAAIVAAPGFDLEAFAGHIASALPSYAVPVFLRFVADLAVTETFKPKKAKLAAEGFDPLVVGDPVFVRDAAGRGYARLDPLLYSHVVDGTVRV